MKPEMLGVIDLGSNAVRMAIGYLADNQQLKLVVSQREAIRLGTDSFKKGFISKRTQERLLQAFERFSTVFRQYGVERCSVAATSALREAKNRAKVQELIYKRLGFRLKILGGLKEARLIYLSVAHQWTLNKKTGLIMDIGGGSIEFIFSRKGKIEAMRSAPIGTVRLLSQLAEPQWSRGRIANRVRTELDRIPLPKAYFMGSNRVAIVTGGNARRLGKLKKSLLKKSTGDRASLKELEEIADRLFSLSPSERVEDIGLAPDRADVILPAVVTVIEFLKFYHLREVLLPDVGLKEGLLYELATRKLPRRKA